MGKKQQKKQQQPKQSPSAKVETAESPSPADESVEKASTASEEADDASEASEAKDSTKKKKEDEKKEEKPKDEPLTTLPPRAGTTRFLAPAAFVIFGVILIAKIGTGDPWTPWVLAITGAAAVAAWFFTRSPNSADPIPPDAKEEASAKEDAEDPAGPWLESAVLALAALPFFLGILVSLEFVKDDAYISFRYAHNLVTGHGLVFNTGERVEGFTNFLWVFVLAPFEALGWDLFQVCEVLGTLLGTACIMLTAKMTQWVSGDERKVEAQLWGAVWLATSSSFALWAKSGLEQPLASLLPIGAAYLLWRARSAEKKERRFLIAGLMMGGGCMTRPELHLLAILVGLPLVVDAIKRRKITRADLLYVVGILAVTAPCHLFRYSYYGSLIPNTFYVKTGTGANVWISGLNTLREMFEFNHSGLLAIFAPLAFANRKRLLEKITMGIIALSFMAYYVAVGVDEMQWHRLYLPALPFLCALAALGVQNLINGVVRVFMRESRGMRDVGFVLAWGLLAVAGGLNFRFTYKEMHGFDGHGDLSGTFHPDMGKFIVRHERPGALVAFQDVGSTPYHAPDINFLDFIGLVDKTVAHARHDYGLHAFVGSDDPKARKSFERDMRDYFFRRKPEWAILTIYGGRGDEARLKSKFDNDPTGASFGDDYRNNPFQFGIWDDLRFRRDYVPVRTWPRSSAYYLALWRRRDLWQQIPREVVLDEPPKDLKGVHAVFEGDIELLGSEITTETIERHEAFITTWWKLPGPMDPDLYFFVHVTNGKVQVPGDHIPGDWMYPANRWRKGDILEDRILFQLPPFTMRPGDYKVYIGAYRMSTGERLKVIEGQQEQEQSPETANRVLLGTFNARRLQPILDQLIPPTRVDIMRKYPDRILQSQANHE